MKRVHPAYRDDIGDLQTRRPVPGPSLAQVDPFLFLNHHGPQVYPKGNGGLPFGPHPHRGFETVTFIVEGELAHQDSAGHSSVIRAGGVQWITAGRGVVHSELSTPDFQRDGGPLEILQLWVNLPARLKMSTPRYFGLQREDIPAMAMDGGRVRVNLASGTINGQDQRGPVPSLTDVHLMTVELQPGGKVELPAPSDRNVFLYIVRGDVVVGGERAIAHQLTELERNGDSVTLEAATQALVLFGHARPLNEPVASYGPFVMNTQTEILQAIRDYQAGRFEDAPVL